MSRYRVIDQRSRTGLVTLPDWIDTDHLDREDESPPPTGWAVCGFQAQFVGEVLVVCDPGESANPIDLRLWSGTDPHDHPLADLYGSYFDKDGAHRFLGMRRESS